MPQDQESKSIAFSAKPASSQSAPRCSRPAPKTVLLGSPKLSVQTKLASSARHLSKVMRASPVSNPIPHLLLHTPCALMRGGRGLHDLVQDPCVLCLVLRLAERRLRLGFHLLSTSLILVNCGVHNHDAPCADDGAHGCTQKHVSIGFCLESGVSRA